MDKAIVGIAIAAILAIAACTTTNGYVICNDLASNTTCPNNTANVIVN